MSVYTVVENEYELFKERPRGTKWTPSLGFATAWEHFDDGDNDRIEAIDIAKKLSPLFSVAIRNALPCEAFDDLHCDEMFDEEDDEDEVTSRPAVRRDTEVVVRQPVVVVSRFPAECSLQVKATDECSPESRAMVNMHRWRGRNRDPVGLVSMGHTGSDSWMTYTEAVEFLDMKNPSVREIESMVYALGGAPNAFPIDRPRRIGVNKAAMVVGNIMSFEPITMLVVRTHVWSVFVPDLGSGEVSSAFEVLVRVYLCEAMGAIDVSFVRVPKVDHLSTLLLVFSDFVKSNEAVACRHTVASPSARRASIIARIVGCRENNLRDAVRVYASTTYPSRPRGTNPSRKRVAESDPSEE